MNYLTDTIKGKKMINPGKYLKMPPTFKKLQRLGEVIEKEGYSLCDLDLCLQLDFPHYEMSPYDVIPFANIGAFIMAS
ncbi:hypothetical protein [Peribacillus sp. V2I11]|uniref:hypothetical protein n=1 Tax=Peribacillus sp. V2I11 TaxID=3042277 RepID=UPI002781A755|nr:hypothetical protein [Peribacillus sp. V2I11]MDQ0884073.1 hypothetical protein [Peribacillus sp. V2I11]